MELVCPLCNGMKELHVKCGRCGTEMKDGGVYTDYEDDYSPYEITAHYRQENGGRCAHLFYCPQCGEDRYAVIQSEWM